MNKKVLTAIIIIIIIAAGLIIWYAMGSGSGYQAPAASNPDTASMPAASSSPAAASPASPATSTASAAAGSSSSNSSGAAPTPQSFTVNGNDSSADLTVITVPKGTPVTITFGADAEGTYHGGLDFRSSVVSTGPIAPGSTKTVTFTAESSFAFTPYWPSTNIAKPYTIAIVVQ